MPKTVCKDSRSSFFKINQRTGVPLSLGNGKFKLLRSPKKAKVKASVNVDANGEFTFAGKSKLKPLSTLSSSRLLRAPIDRADGDERDR